MRRADKGRGPSRRTPRGTGPDVPGATDSSGGPSAAPAGTPTTPARPADDVPGSARERSAGSERVALLISLAGSVVLGTGAILWGLLASATVLVFDGVFTVAGVALTGLSLLVARVARAAPSGRYPFGRPALTTLTVGMHGAAIAATLAYGTSDAVGAILDGGSPAGGWTLIWYGAASALLCAGLSAVLGRIAGESDLVRAERASWRAGAVLSAVVLVGGCLALALVRSGRAGAAAYVDPVLVLIAVALVVRLPVRLVRQAVHELLEGAPPLEVQEAVLRAVAGTRERFGLPEPVVRATKTGPRLYLEIAFVVPGGRWTLEGEDEVRRDLTRRLDLLPFDVWADVDLTTDAGLVT